MNLQVNYLATKRKESETKTSVDCGNIATGVRNVTSEADAIKLGEGSVSGVYVQNSYSNVDGDTNFIVVVCDKAHRSGIQLMPGQITPLIATDNLRNIWIFGFPVGGEEVAFKGARVAFDGSQVIPTGTSTPLDFGTVNYDTGAFITGSTFVPDVDGFYEVGVIVQFESNDSGVRQVEIAVDGPGFASDIRSAIVGAGNDSVAATYAVLQLTAGQVVTFNVVQDSGGNLNITGGQGWFNFRGGA